MVTLKKLSIFAPSFIIENMENPFVFGKAAEGPNFTDRIEDAKRLEANLTHGINTILISPRRFGKTSLVKKVIENTHRSDIIMVYIDVFACKSEYDFYRTFATTIIRQTSSKIDEWIASAQSFLSNISPKFSFGADPMNDFSLSFDWNPRENAGIEDLLNLPEQIAKKKGVRIVVCIDEFQQIEELPDPVTFQKKLRSVWQHQQHVTYCMFGSKKHMMTYLFSDPSRPFYKFGDMMFLQRIPTEEWVSFITQRFKDSGKTISRDQALRICMATENLSSYVQHLSWIVWYSSDRVVSNKNVDEAIDGLLEQNKVFLQREIEQLTELQFNFLKAIANGVTSGLSKKDVLRKYRLDSSANVQVVKKALISKDIIDDDDNGIVFNDPLLKLWILRNTFID